VVAFPALDTNFLNQELLAGNGLPFSSFFNTHGLQTLATEPDTAGIFLRPQIASNNTVVYEDASGNIVVNQYNPSVSSPTPTVIAPATITANVSDRPGISADGNWVAFGGTLTGLNPGLFVSQSASSGSGPKLLLVTGAGGDPTTPNAMFNSFGVRPSAGSDQARFGIAAQPTPAGVELTVVFVAQRSYLDPTTHAVTSTVYGIYRLSAIATIVGGAATYQVTHVDPIVEVGNTIPDSQGGVAVTRTVADFDLWDPVSKDGVYAGFWVQFKETGAGGTPIQAAVRARL
jgi:hypothetical protein